MAAPVVSVLMAVYNAESFLEQALDSLLVGQTLRDIEVLAVDDASTDGSLAILNRRASADHRLRVFCQEKNQGQAKARNLALTHAQGDFICMVDADDWLSLDALELAVSEFRQHSQADCVVFRLLKDFDDHDEFFIAEGTMENRVLTGDEAFRMSLDWTLHGLYMVRRELHLRYPYDDSLPLYSDDNTCHLHYLHSREVRFCNGIYYYRQHAGSATSSITPNYFLLIKSNLILRQTLEKEGVDKEILMAYDRYRWHTFRGQLWTYFDNEERLKDAKKQLRQDFNKVYDSFPRILPNILYFAFERMKWRLRRRFF